MILSRFAWPLAGAFLAVAAVGVQEARVQRGKTELTQERQARSSERAAALLVALQATDAARMEDRRRAAALKGVIDEADKNAAVARADADAARASVAGLQQRARAAAARCGRVPQGATPAASGPADRLADVLTESVERYRTLAETLDRAVIAGNACATAYDSLTAEEKNQ